MGQTAALYCRVSTADQSCARQERDLLEFAARAGYEVVGIWKETASGARQDRPRQANAAFGSWIDHRGISRRRATAGS